MTAAETVFKKGFAPNIPTAGLESLLLALHTDDPALVQGSTTIPLPLTKNLHLPVEAACAISWATWHAEGMDTVLQVEERFGDLCAAADGTLNERAACRYFLNEYDDTPREIMFPRLARWIEHVLADRGLAQPTPEPCPA